MCCSLSVLVIVECMGAVNQYQENFELTMYICMCLCANITLYVHAFNSKSAGIY